jgi:DNA-binding transcriptional MerR regulator
MLQDFCKERIILTSNVFWNRGTEMSDFEKAYSTKEVSLTLDIGTSTLRKWCIALEENGYQFLRNEQNGRSFVEGDLVALKHFKHLVQKENFTLDNAAKIVTSKYKGGASKSITPAVLPEKKEETRDLMRSDEIIQSLLDHIERQEQFNRELLERLDRQQKYIEERLNDRDQRLMEAMRSVQENQKLLAATQEEKRKGLWSRLFGK